MRLLRSLHFFGRDDRVHVITIADEHPLVHGSVARVFHVPIRLPSRSGTLAYLWFLSNALLAILRISRAGLYLHDYYTAPIGWLLHRALGLRFAYDAHEIHRRRHRVLWHAGREQPDVRAEQGLRVRAGGIPMVATAHGPSRDLLTAFDMGVAIGSAAVLAPLHVGDFVEAVQVVVRDWQRYRAGGASARRASLEWWEKDEDAGRAVVGEVVTGSPTHWLKRLDFFE